MASRLRPILLVPDVHAPFHDPRAWRLMLRVARDLDLANGGTVVVLGDLIDAYPLSRFTKDPARKQTIADELRVARRLRADLDRLKPARRVFIEGNHEHRLQRYVHERAPALAELVPSIPEALGLAGWEYVPYRSDIKIGDLYLTHDVGKTGRYAAQQGLDAMGAPIVTAHSHRMSYVVENGHVDGPRVSAQLGWLGNVEAIDYAHRAAVRRSHVLGFGVGWLDPRDHVHVQPVPIIDYGVAFNGRYYTVRAQHRHLELVA